MNKEQLLSKKEQLLSKKEQIEKIAKIVLIAGIFLYPFLCSFFGIDLGDTGIHMFNYENIYSNPDKVGFTCYLTNVLAWGWLQIFGGLGIWGLNLLEVIVEMVMAFAVYKVFHKYLGDLQTLFGILIAIMASDTYLNIFNYHQFNVFFLILILGFEFKAVVEKKFKYSFVAGIFLTLVVFSRMGSITALVTCFIYVFSYLYNNEDVKYFMKHLGVFAGGVAATFGVLAAFLAITGQVEYFINNIFRLSGIASTAGSGYSMENLWSTFIFGNLDAIASGVIYLAASMILLLGMNILFSLKGIHTKKIILNIAFSAVVIGIAVYMLVYAYDVNTVPNWPQITTGPSFFIGILYVVTFCYVFFNMYSKNGNPDLIILGICAIMLPLLTIAGSNTGTKHVILAFWIIAPFAVSAVCRFVFSKAALEAVNVMTEKYGLKIRHGAVLACTGIVLVCMGVKFADMLYCTMNFDSVDRSSLRYSVNSDKLKYMKTTEREADAVNGVLDCINHLDEEKERPLMVFGGAILMYSLNEMESYVQPWVTNPNYTEEKLKEDLKLAKENWEEKPVVIFCRTNNYYGFEEYNYDVLIESELYNQYNGKKDWFMKFLHRNDYRLEYANDYYIVLAPGDMTKSEDYDYNWYIVGE